MSECLAIKGGTPVREKPLPLPYPGAAVMGKEETESVMKVLDSRSLFRYYGYNVQQMAKSFENAFSEKFSIRYSLGVTSGTASLMVALKAAGIGPGDKVIVPAETFLATAGAVLCAGAVPVFADIDDSLSMDPSQIDELCDKYTKAVVPVHVLGNPCEMDRIMEAAKRNNIIVIEDVAQSCGTKYKGQYAGSFGDIGCFSLQLNKIITTGDGGIVATNDHRLYERAVRYHDQGMYREVEGFTSTAEREEVFPGQNYRMPEINGAIALEQLKKLDFIIERMKSIKKQIKDGIRGIRGISFRQINDEEGDAGNVIVLMLESKERANEFIKAINAENIGMVSLHSGLPVYMLPQIFKQRSIESNWTPYDMFDEKIVYTENMCPFCASYLPRNATLFLSPDYTERDIADVIAAVKKVANQIL